MCRACCLCPTFPCFEMLGLCVTTFSIGQIIKTSHHGLPQQKPATYQEIILCMQLSLKQKPLPIPNESDRRLNLAHDKKLNLIMNINNLKTIAQLEQFLTGVNIVPVAADTDHCYANQKHRMNYGNHYIRYP